MVSQGTIRGSLATVVSIKSDLLSFIVARAFLWSLFLLRFMIAVKELLLDRKVRPSLFSIIKWDLVQKMSMEIFHWKYKLET